MKIGKAAFILFFTACFFLHPGFVHAEKESDQKPDGETKKDSSILKTVEDIKGKLSISGDFRGRLENDFNRDATTDTRTRGRIRFRLGLDFPVNDDVTVGARFATGPLADPNSPHATFTGAFDRPNFSLDRAFVRWIPSFFEEMTLWLGKFGHPFATPVVYPELVWDQDVQPEGGAVGFTFRDLGIVKKLNVVNGSYILLEQDPGSEAWMNGSQVATTFQFASKLELTAATGFYYYSNVNAGAPGADAIVRNDNGGNTAMDNDGDGTADSFVSGFRILDSFMDAAYTGLPMPLAFQAQYLHNFGANAARNDGYAFGIAYGQLKKQWDWRAYYQYQRVQQDAVFSPFSQDDFLRQTNFKGHLLGIALAVYKNVDLHAWGLIDELDSAPGGNQQVRSRVDLNVKF
ncbi:MAG: putative porin [Deltaproteobacteria bacterium]|nr:putative porin [Deltaproteobacteria bacterium]